MKQNTTQSSFISKPIHFLAEVNEKTSSVDHAFDARLAVTAFGGEMRIYVALDNESVTSAKRLTFYGYEGHIALIEEFGDIVNREDFEVAKAKSKSSLVTVDQTYSATGKLLSTKRSIETIERFDVFYGRGLMSTCSLSLTYAFVRGMSKMLPSICLYISPPKVGSEKEGDLFVS